MVVRIVPGAKSNLRYTGLNRLPLWMVELDGRIVLRVPHGRRTLARCVADRLRRAKCVTLHPNQGVLNRYLAHLQTHLRQRRRHRGAALLARQERVGREFSDCYSAIEDEVGFQSCIREKETARELRQRVVI